MFNPWQYGLKGLCHFLQGLCLLQCTSRNLKNKKKCIYFFPVFQIFASEIIRMLPLHVKIVRNLYSTGFASYSASEFTFFITTKFVGINFVKVQIICLLPKISSSLEGCFCHTVHFLKILWLVSQQMSNITWHPDSNTVQVTRDI